ncbi:DUF6397 family protein [Actinacidiphila sp. bgisy167]|uniref:DUF6397 family protein n=1 Tax=Actinacidiphila sp. bgisy167 TaxID=3413797 RepID=UPI003D73B84B
MAVKEAAVREALGMQRAREELCLQADEFEVALQIGEVRTAPAVGGRRRVVREDVDRLRGEEGFPDGLRARLALVGGIEAAAMIGISRERFTRLAKSGFLRPVRWYVNRYRAVVWLYLAEDVRRFAREHPALLEGRLPAELREALDGGEDQRARGWRSRRVEELVRDAEDAWAEAAAWAALLGPRAAAEAVSDVRERACLRGLCPALPAGSTGPYASRELIEAQVVACDPDEIAFAHVSLADALIRARAIRPAPRPERGAPAAAPVAVDIPPPAMAPPPPSSPLLALPPTSPPTAPLGRWKRLLGLRRPGPVPHDTSTGGDDDVAPDRSRGSGGA